VKHLFLILSIFLLTSPLFCQETGVLYQYKISSGFVWKTFGKGKVQPKYEGEISTGIPEGVGILSYPFDDGKTAVGEWKDGKEWNTEHYSKEGKVLGKWENGKRILMWGVLFESKVNGISVWSENGNKIEEGNYKNGLLEGYFALYHPNGSKSLEGSILHGKKNGLFAMYHENGVRSFRGEYFDGVGKGKWVYYNEEGAKIRKKDCDFEECK